MAMMIKGKRKNSIMDELGVDGTERGFTRPYGSVYTYYLCGEIREPQHYVQAFDAIRNAGSSDIVQIVINSGGGDVMTAMQMRQSMFSCQAHIQTIVEGMCASAATMIFLAGDEMIIEPHAMFMVHNYSGGCVGKGHEMAQQITFEAKWASDFMHDIYKDFMTRQEVTSVLEGKDFWMNGTQVLERLESMIKKREKTEKSQKTKTKAG